MTLIIGATMERTLAEIVRLHRKHGGLARNQLADLAGVGKTVIYDIEAGKETIRFATLKKILNALNIKMIFTSPVMEDDREKG
jgi:HTH-type transcriptional regulator/antitoxin HipB